MCPNAYFAVRERAGYCCCCWRHRGRLNPARAFSYFTCSMLSVWFSHSLLPVDSGNLAICNPRCPLKQQKLGFHLERRQPEQPTLHFQKPGSCVSLLPAKRGRTRRGPKPRPCCGAAHLHVSFHDKHFHRWSRTLFYLFLRLPGSCLHWGATEQRWKGKNIYGERATCVIISSLPSSSVSFPFKSAANGSKLTAVVFSGGSLAALCSGTIQYAPDPSLFLMAVSCVLSSEGPSLSPAPRFCCSNVLSAPHITSKPPKLRTDTFLRAKNLRQGSGKAFTKRRSQKCQNFEKRKPWPRRDNPSKCIHVCCRWKSNPRCQTQFL